MGVQFSAAILEEESGVLLDSNMFKERINLILVLFSMPTHPPHQVGILLNYPFQILIIRLGKGQTITDYRAFCLHCRHSLAIPCIANNLSLSHGADQSHYQRLRGYNIPDPFNQSRLALIVMSSSGRWRSGSARSVKMTPSPVQLIEAPVSPAMIRSLAIS